MCGLFGFIGESKNPELTKDLSTALFVKTQVRGTDASGFYCVENFPNKQVLYYKKPIPAIEFVNLAEYKAIWQNNINLGLFHCRAASAGVGIPAYNENNHPFVSRCLKKAVIHNGVINKNEYETLKYHYEVETECDSELFLRILEQDEDFLDKVKNFLMHSKNSHYAVAYGEVEEDFRKLHLFRNEHRPLIVVDLREELNQIFFCSTTAIFFESVDVIKKRIKNYRFYELPKNGYIELSLHNNFSIELSEYNFSLKETPDKSFDLPMYKLKTDKSNWKNFLSLEKQENLNDVISGMKNKFSTISNSITNKLDKLNMSDIEKNKANYIFANLKDINKRCDALLKNLGE